MTHKTAVVTGGGQSIGKAIARRFLVGGYAVVIGDVDEEAGMETANEYAALGPVRFVKTDVADEHQVRTLMATAVADYGGIDVLVNNAAIAWPYNSPLETLDLAYWNRVLAVNLTGPLLCAKHAAPHLKARKGAIINISSTRALMSEPHSEAYAASKGGLVALTHALALSLGPEVRVNCISPGWIATADWRKSSERHAPAHSAADHAQHPVGRLGQPDDIAAMVEFLAGPQSSFITGANYVVDGGMTRKLIYV